MRVRKPTELAVRDLPGGLVEPIMKPTPFALFRSLVLWRAHGFDGCWSLIMFHERTIPRLSNSLFGAREGHVSKIFSI